MKIPIKNGIKSGGSSFLLQDAVNAIDKIEFNAGDSSLRVISITSHNKDCIWILLSSGILHEYDFSIKNSTIIENDDPISFFKIL